MDILLMDPHFTQKCILCKPGPGKSYFARGRFARKNDTEIQKSGAWRKVNPGGTNAACGDRGHGGRKAETGKI